MKLMIKWVGVCIGVLALIAVRYFQHNLFYDPLIAFFHGDFEGNPLPEFNMTRYVIHLALRYGLNVLISLGIIAWFFQNRQHVQLSALVYGIVGILLFTLLIIWLQDTESTSHIALFYTRRMLMHPLLLFVLFPALYFQDLKGKK